MSNSYPPELWFITPPHSISGFLIIATPGSDRLDKITRSMIDNQYRLAATLSDKDTSIHIKNDCGLVFQNCQTEDGLHYIGGSILPYLSKRKLLGKLAVPTLFLGIALFTVMSFIILVLISASFAFLLGNLELALNIGQNYQLLFQIFLVLIAPFSFFVLVFIAVNRKLERILDVMKEDVKDILKEVYPEYDIHEVKTNYLSKSKQITDRISFLLNHFSENIPEVTHEQIREYESTEYSM
jgi:hypothetical protein